MMVLTLLVVNLIILAFNTWALVFLYEEFNSRLRQINTDLLIDMAKLSNRMEDIKDCNLQNVEFGPRTWVQTKKPSED